MRYPSLRYPAPGSGHRSGQGGVCGYELQRPLSGAERPDPHRAHHLQQVPLGHHGSLRRHPAAQREPGHNQHFIYSSDKPPSKILRELVNVWDKSNRNNLSSSVVYTIINMQTV